MKTLIYLLQVSACTGIFYAFYFVFLRRLTFFTLNRWYLLTTLLLSFLVPCLTITLRTASPLPVMKPVIIVEQIQSFYQPVAGTFKQATVSQEFNWTLWLQMLYTGVAVALLGHLLLTLSAFFRKIRSLKLMQIGHVKILKGDSRSGNSSFLNIIFINDEELAPAEVEQIIAHELLHIRLLHSADRLISRLVQIILWFNPFAYLYIRSIEENHEFEVDRIAAGEDEKGLYAQLLLKLAISGQSYLFHSFSKVPLKKRIMMLFNQPTSNMKKLIYLLIPPVVVMSCLAFANLRSDEKLSVVNDLRLLGPHPLVLVDGKIVADAILYKIGGACVSRISTDNPPISPERFKQYGVSAKDGIVSINTKHHRITYQTAIERQNLSKKAAVPASQFYTRLRLKHEDGSNYDDARIRMPNGGTMSADLKKGASVVFLVGGKAYPESEVATVEQLVRMSNPGSYTVGPVKKDAHRIKADYSKYDTFFDFFNDTNKRSQPVAYRQKIKMTKARFEAEELSKLKFALYQESEEYRMKKAAMEKISGKTSTFKVIALTDTATQMIGRVRAYKVRQGTDEYLLRAMNGHEDVMNEKIKPGDELEIKAASVFFSEGNPIIIQPEVISRGGVKLFEIPAGKTNANAFLYEANKVRYAQGRLTEIAKYPNGKWKSAVVLSNGYHINVHFKPSAPAFAAIQQGDDVCFRFVHEVKTSARAYNVDDWVALTKNPKDYGVKNPDFFHKFYE